ncbi:hypothetical protein F441_02891, partial [Phytophthora nicotianae CJ01A1]
MTPDLVEDLFQLDAKRRTQRRAAQQRYRKMINDRTDTLAVDTQRLKEEIKQLELQHKLLHSRIPSEATPWNVVVEYFRLFRYGCKVPALTTEPHKHHGTLVAEGSSESGRFSASSNVTRCQCEQRH